MKEIYGLRYRLILTFLALVIGIIIAGFWNYKVVDGFGHHIADRTIGNTNNLASTFSENGTGFGFIFACVAGLAATFTACNCVVFAMIPGLTYSNHHFSRKMAIRALIVFITGVLAICAFYGFIIGLLTPGKVDMLNQSNIRINQAEITFSLIGTAMLIWGVISFGFLNRLLVLIPLKIRYFLANPFTKSAIMGIFVGLFSIGRPFPVFRDFLTYAAASKNPFYGAAVMSMQGLGQIAVMVLLFLIIIFIFGKKLIQWTERKPHQLELISSIALTTGGTYFIYYWGISRILDIGGWGFKFGWYQ
ncbi:hypothetical protein [Priestia sp. P5]|uniref:hypothetical protein n=1 Tax=Priestia sp. P5 TaxID=2917806 RepID=UPI002406D010|nr:hypothetical protein [Priestia sp. P5]MDG0059143.1 hypothetical protein [Priestia sp. P5]